MLFQNESMSNELEKKQEQIDFLTKHCDQLTEKIKESQQMFNRSQKNLRKVQYILQQV